MANKFTKNEQRLFNYLKKHAGFIVSKKTLLREVWTCEFDPGTNRVEVSIYRLRRKLMASSALQYDIHTCYGRGYKLVEIAPVASSQENKTHRAFI